ncbi:BrnA antitoxin family protein [Methylobacterium sp. JK268]
MPPSSANPYGETDFAKVDAHVITAEEYEELPELTDEDLAAADEYVGPTLVRRGRGRPRLEAPKRQVTLRLDPDVIDRFRASGPGWQVRINAILREALDRG